jgi:Protein of unknown function (DUF4230)
MLKRRVSGIGLLLAAIFISGLIFGWMIPRWLAGRRPITVYNTATILKQVQTLSELVTVKYVMEKVEIQQDPPEDWFRRSIPFSEALTWDRVILVAHGIVKAGVDLSQLGPGDVRITDKKISVRLPMPRITDAYLDEKQTQVIEHTTGLLRTLNKDLEQTTRQNALDDIRRAARSNGILKDAEDRARVQMEHLFHQLGFKEVEFRGP